MRKRTESLSLKLPGRQPMVLLHLLFYALFRGRIVELYMLLSILRENFIKVMNWIYWTFLRLRKIRRHIHTTCSYRRSLQITGLTDALGELEMSIKNHAFGYSNVNYYLKSSMIYS